MLSNQTQSIFEEMEFEKLNARFGGALKKLDTSEHELIGREKELHVLSTIMARPKRPVALLLARAGTGKTALVEGWIKQQESEGKQIILLALVIANLARDGMQIFRERLENLIPELSDYQKYIRDYTNNNSIEIVLFVDEIHKLISEGGKAGGDAVKTSLERIKIKLIGATTLEEYDEYIAGEEAFARRFVNLEMSELLPSQTLYILKNYMSTYTHSRNVYEEITEDTFEYIMQANKLYREQFAEPAKSIDICDHLLGISKVDNVKIDKKLVSRAFLELYNIDLDFEANFNKVEQTIMKRVIGQPVAVYTAISALKRISFQLERSNRPQTTMLLSGSTGVGKTELAKAIAEGIYQDESCLVNINIPDYRTADSEARFRRRLGTIVYHNPSAIILLDEIEKAHDNVMTALLPILDEGNVTYTVMSADGYEFEKRISLKNTIIIATTNAGADMQREQAKYSRSDEYTTSENVNSITESLKMEWRSSEANVKEAILTAKGMRPEILNRFQQIVPFFGLSEAAKVSIVANRIKNKLKLLEERKGITVKLPPVKNWGDDYKHIEADAITMYVVYEADATKDTHRGGARNLMTIIDRDIVGAIVEAYYKNPVERNYLLQTNGLSAFENENYKVGSGEVIAIPRSINYI
ncbi:AAA family ATPase [Listeria welshimeri]|uniref:AAA family ATPase n=1 Tax=Listeria welshimeri TaxID=1643 RepID=UPI001627276A|nr:AAA family ATPase [Listeria welshimeri]MBC1342339.1 ATP-dependent Clp protease ATP-binding subunit [Listeria welshimeri]MBC1350708.1 ATP-dependent Clp protease ATP-binding subunit [Listeria welshimeri]MBF2342540.1 ATP-dependent Clp protease ATP-binding subunit [Listeria welshimeri]